MAEPMPSCAVLTLSANSTPATAPSAEEIAKVTRGDPVDVDAEHRGGVRVLRDGAHPAAQPGLA